jgi:hypothetical protein
MKYLKLILNEELPEGCHITFAYFGKEFDEPGNAIDIEVLSKLLGPVCPFILTYDREDNFGPNGDIPVQVYKHQSISCKRARKSILSIFNVSDRNFEDWTPHVSKWPENRGRVYELNVIGVESNDGSFRHMFTVTQ